VIRRLLLPLMLTIVAAVAVVAALISIQNLPALAPPQWASGPLAISGMIPVGGKRVTFSGYVQFDIEGHFYLTRATISLRQLAIAADNKPVADPSVYRRELHDLVWEYINDPDCYPWPSELTPLVNQAIDAPGTVESRDFAEAAQAESSIQRSLWTIVAGLVVLLGAGAWLCAAAFPKRRATLPPA
jgi:hypothetical protein